MTPFLQNKALNEVEVAEERIVLESKPRGMGITLTTRCNLNCIMCDVYESLWDIPEETVKEIIQFMPYLQQIIWQGGEVFLSRYFESLFEKASSYSNLRQLIVTSGILIDDKWAKKLVKSKTSLNYSIDGVTRDTYETIRRGAKFKDLLESIDIVNKYREKYRCDGKDSDKFTMIMNVVIMKSNYHQLTHFVDFAKSYNFETLLLSPVQKVTNYENIFLHKDLEADKYIEKNIPEVIEKARKWGITLYNMLPNINDYGSGNKEYGVQSERTDTCLKVDHNTDKLLCYWPWQHLFIETDGNVRPHCYCPKEIGNVYVNSLEEIWNSEEMQFYRKKILDNDYRLCCNQRCASGAIPGEQLSFNHWDNIG